MSAPSVSRHGISTNAMAKDYRRRHHCQRCLKRFKQWGNALAAGHVWCSRACRRLDTGEERPPFPDDDGYIEVWDDMRRRYVLEHRQTMVVLDNPYVVVHHRDENRANNEPENLEVLGWFEHINERH